MSYKFKDTSKIKYCPLCKDDLIRLDTYQCGCSYIICYECYNDIKQKENHCPKCRKQYANEKYNNSSNNNNNYNNNLIEKKKRYQQDTRYQKQQKQYVKKQTQQQQDLAQVRIIKKNLVYIIGLSPQLAKEEVLQRKEYFGQYGKINKVVVNKINIYNPNGKTPSYSAFITYSNEKEASYAVLAIEEFELHGRMIRASYGTTKYCTSFLNNQECPNREECLYLHSFGRDKDTFAKDEIISNKNIFTEQQRIAFRYLNKSIPDLVKQKIMYDQNQVELSNKLQLPHPSSIIKKLVAAGVVEQANIDQLIQLELSQSRNKQNQEEKISNGDVGVAKSTLVDQWSEEIIQIPQAVDIQTKKKPTVNIIDIQKDNDEYEEEEQEDEPQLIESQEPQLIQKQQSLQTQQQEYNMENEQQQGSQNSNKISNNNNSGSEISTTQENSQSSFDLENNNICKKQQQQENIIEQEQEKIGSNLQSKVSLDSDKEFSTQNTTNNVCDNNIINTPVKNNDSYLDIQQQQESEQKNVNNNNNVDSLEQKIINSLFNDEQENNQQQKQNQKQKNNNGNSNQFSIFGGSEQNHNNTDMSSFISTFNNMYSNNAFQNNNNNLSTKTSSRFEFAQSFGDEANKNKQNNNVNSIQFGMFSNGNTQQQQQNQKQKQHSNINNQYSCFDNMLYCNNYDPFNNKIQTQQQQQSSSANLNF